jgi:hypothetical protein
MGVRSGLKELATYTFQKLKIASTPPWPEAVTKQLALSNWHPDTKNIADCLYIL